MGIELITYNVNEARTIQSGLYLAEVELKIDGSRTEPPAVVSRGYGPVQALYNAIKKATGIKVDRERWVIESPNGSKHAVAKAIIEKDGTKYEEAGEDPDEVRAAAIAFINALNKMLQSQQRA